MPAENSPRAALKSWLQFLLGMGVIALAGLAVFILRPKANLPPGWMTVIPPNDVMALVEYQGSIWSGGKDGLYQLDRSSGELLAKVEVDDGPDFRFTYALLVGKQGHDLWVGHLNGLSHFDGENWQTYTHDDGLSNEQVLSLAHNPNGELWIGTRTGLSRYDPAGEQISPLSSEAPQTAISVLFFNPGGNLWAGNGFSKEGGLFKYDGHHWESLGIEQGLAHPMVSSILNTHDGELWFGTGLGALGGLSIMDGQTWRTLTEESGLAGGKVRYIFQDQAGVFWVGSEYYGIVRMAQAGWQTLTPDHGLAGWEVKAMLQDLDGNLWLGTENGLTRISHAAWQNLDALDFSE
jgi:ligand-binding sensor domain-containing protein